MEYQGKLISIGFNVGYLIDVPQVLGSEGKVQIEPKDKLSPSLVKKGGKEGYLYVLMRMVFTSRFNDR